MKQKIIIAVGAVALLLVFLFMVNRNGAREETSRTPSQPISPPSGILLDEPLPATEFTEPASAPGGSPTSDVLGEPSEGNSNTSPVPIAIEFAPDFTLPRIDGKGDAITLSDYRGVKPVILDFFAPHCPNCRRNVKTQVPLYEKYKDQIEIIVLAIDPPKANQRYFDDNPVPMPVVYDETEQILKAYSVRFTNTHILIAKDGSLVETLPGTDIIEADFKRLLE